MRAQQTAEWEAVPEFWQATDEMADRYDLGGRCNQPNQGDNQ